MNEHDELSDFVHMWDGSETWVLEGVPYLQSNLTVVFAGPNPTVQELVELRRASEAFREVPVAQLKAELAGKGEVPLGRHTSLFHGIEAREAEERIRQLAPSLRLRVESRSYTSCLPVKLAEKGEWRACIIEDETLNEKVVARMIEHGVPINSAIEID